MVKTCLVSSRFVTRAKKLESRAIAKTRLVSTRFVGIGKDLFREHSPRKHFFREQSKKTSFVKARLVSSHENSFREQFHNSREQKW